MEQIIHACRKKINLLNNLFIVYGVVETATIFFKGCFYKQHKALNTCLWKSELLQNFFVKRLPFRATDSSFKPIRTLIFLTRDTSCHPYNYLESILISVVFPIPFLPTRPYLLPKMRDSSASFNKTLKQNSQDKCLKATGTVVKTHSIKIKKLFNLLFYYIS